MCVCVCLKFEVQCICDKWLIEYICNSYFTHTCLFVHFQGAVCLHHWHTVSTHNEIFFWGGCGFFSCSISQMMSHTFPLFFFSSGLLSTLNFV